MIKIIQKGQLPALKVYKVTCRYCTSVLEFTQQDGKIHYDQRDGDYIEILCPVCTSILNINK